MGGSRAAGAVADAFDAPAIISVCGVTMAAARAAFAGGLKGCTLAVRPACLRQSPISGARA